MKRQNIILILVLFLFSCSEKRTVANPQELIEADIAFSDFSVKNGYQKAFIEFADDSAVLLKKNRMPIIGKQNLIKSYEGTSDSGMVLVWKPEKAVVSSAGDLGYTYGLWTFVAEGDTSKGKYLTVWKCDSSGHWKYVADAGNEGLGRQ